MENIKKTNKRKRGKRLYIILVHWFDLSNRKTRFNERKTFFVPLSFHFVKVCRSGGGGAVWCSDCFYSELRTTATSSSTVEFITTMRFVCAQNILILASLRFYSFLFALCLFFFLLFFITSIFLGSSPLVASQAHAACLLEFQSYGSK